MSTTEYSCAAQPCVTAAANRDAMIEELMPLARTLALTAWRRKGMQAATIGPEDFISAANFGLVKAVDGFNPASGTSLAQWARVRCEGAISDYLKEQDHLPRGMRTAVKRQAATIAAGGVVENPLPVCRNISLQETGSKPDSDSRFASLGPSPEALAVEAQATLRALARLGAVLSPTQMFVIKARYFQEQPLGDTAAALGVTMLRLAQLRTGAIARLAHQRDWQTASGRG